jgi:hypothetical protein
MAVNYSFAEQERPRDRSRRWSLWWRALLLASAASPALACATGGSPAPRGAPPLAAGSTPEPVRYEVVLPGRRAEVRARLVRLLSDSLFHVDPSEPGDLSAYNLAHLVKVRVDLTAQGKDSVRVGLTGETYLGDTARRDSISGLPERWRLLTATDANALVLRGLARSLRLNRADGRALDVAGSVDGDSANRLGSAPSRDGYGVAVLANTPVGRAIDLCRSASVPVGWLILYWYVDRSQCTHLPDSRYPGEPNMMRIEREW